MIRDLGLHGTLGPVDFYSYVSGADARGSYFYEDSPTYIRFFSRGNEFTITETGLDYKGAGGNFCEYMFGVEKPLGDLVKKDILNRLIMFGAYLDKKEKLVFTSDTSGEDTFYRLFMQGHAVKNYFFFVSSDKKTPMDKRQREILSTLGKLLKRTELIYDDNDNDLINELVRELKESDSTLLLFKLIHRGNQRYYSTYAERYMKGKALSAEDEEILHKIADEEKIDFYQQERMKIDVMYKHPDNRPVVDEYRDILIDSSDDKTMRRSEVARLKRLRTLSIRNNIPNVLFETLDEFLLKGKKILDTEEPEYLVDARAIIENIFFKDPELKQHIINEDIIKLIRAKHAAYANGDMGFERILLDVGKACDETARETNDYSLLEEFSSIVTYFDRYDHVQASMSQIAFMENMTFSDDFLRSLLGNIKEFEEIESGLFQELFVSELLNNKYITNFGRKKIRSVVSGLDKVSLGDASLKEVMSELEEIVTEERYYNHVHTYLRVKVQSFYTRLDIKEIRDELKSETEKILKEKELVTEIPEATFEKVFLDLKKEGFYVNNMLPTIIKNTDSNLREDFIKNSGLDRFYIESLEKDYFDENNLDGFLLNLIRGESVSETPSIESFEGL